MCGIFGAIGKYQPSKVKILGLLNESRGKDSCGFFNGRKILKFNSPIKEVLGHKYLDHQHKFIMGHTRLATRGRVTEKNAHPFQYEKIIGTHNGMVYNFDQLLTDYGVDMEVDSEIIFWGLNFFGKDFFKELNAYWGLAWVDRRDPTGFFLSAHDNKVAVAHAQGSIYYSSDIEDLKRLGLKPYNLKEDKIYRIDINTLQITTEKLKGLNGFGYDSYRGYGSYTPASWQNTFKKKNKEVTAEILDPLDAPLSLAEEQELNLLEEKERADEPLTDDEYERYYELTERSMLVRGYDY